MMELILNWFLAGVRSNSCFLSIRFSSVYLMGQFESDFKENNALWYLQFGFTLEQHLAGYALDTNDNNICLCHLD